MYRVETPAVRDARPVRAPDAFVSARQRMQSVMQLPVLGAIPHAHALTLATSIAGGVAVLGWRVRETRRPVSPQSIVIPPLGMSTGFCMFLAPMMRVPWSWAVVAFLVGAFVLWYPLARSSSLTWHEEQVVMRRSPAFLMILLGLLIVRLALHDYLEHVISPQQTAAVFFILAFGMILRWRTAMYVSYRRLRAAHAG